MDGPDGVPVRLVTYNVHPLTSGANRVSGVLRELRPDIVCLQEAPQRLRWRTRAADLARRAGLVYVTGGRPGAGTMLLCAQRAFVARQETVPLPRTPGLHQRGLAVAVFRIGQQLLVVGSMHLGLDEAERQRHLDVVLPRMRSLAERHDAPYVLAGDVNERQQGAAWRRVASTLRDGHAVAPHGGTATFRRGERIDGVFVSDGIEVNGCGVPDVPGTPAASDHRPVLADLRMPSR